MNLLNLYQSYGAAGSSGEHARELLTQTHWLSVNVSFDPKTGEALPQSLSAFLAKVAGKPPVEGVRDRLWRITAHARSSVERLIRTLNESPRREHAVLPVRAVRQLDANSFIKLSNRPGRNIREKLANKPYLQAVRRFQSVDLPENRLFKAFVTRLAENLQLRTDYLGESEDQLVPMINLWLRSDDAKAIARWENLPPNNALLSHRDYRRVWDAWRWLQTLDDDIARDISTFESRAMTMRRWNESGQMYLEGKRRFADMPILFDYDTFDIRPWSSKLAIQKANPPIVRSSVRYNAIDEPVCVDIAILRPRYATVTLSPASLRDTFLWQQWHNDSESVDITLFESDAAYLHPEATSIATPDLFFSADSDPDHLDRAARAFVTRLHATFTNDTFIWLVPDVLNDFELEIIRRNLNAHFPSAEPLPRSVAAAFEQVDYSKITNDGYPIVVVDTVGTRTCVTRLIARFDAELEDHVPETRGYYWERCPKVILADQASSVNDLHVLDMVSVDDRGLWRGRTRRGAPLLLDANTLKSDRRIGNFAFYINLSASPVSGGIRIHSLQQRARDIPLWRDQVPELSIKVMKDGLYQRFDLVARETTVKPLRGHIVRMPVAESFTLPAGRPHYQFPLFQGENADEVGYSVRLDSPAFPLKADAVCRLDLTFAYGADEPYTLSFSPLDNSFTAIKATWQRTVEEIVIDAPAPDYPTPLTWADLSKMPKPDTAETKDFLDWVLHAVDGLLQERVIGLVCTPWKVDRNNKRYAFAQCDDTDGSVFIHEHEFVIGCDHTDFAVGNQISFDLHEGDKGFVGRRVAGPDYHETAEYRAKSIRRQAYVPFIQIWKDGRSITDSTCPRDFVDPMEVRIAYLTRLMKRIDIEEKVRNTLFFLLSCLHRDTTDTCVTWITNQVGYENIQNPRAIGFALGDMSCDWQREVFRKLASSPSRSALSAFAHAIWREQGFVGRFSYAELQGILTELSRRLSNIGSVTLDELMEDYVRYNWIRASTETLELLLGLLRTRASKNADIRMLLQPHQKITKEFAKHLERVTDVIVRSNVTLYSRVQLNVQKPAGDRTPDLLYALRLYLTGDDGANAIHITGVSDDDTD